MVEKKIIEVLVGKVDTLGAAIRLGHVTWRFFLRIHNVRLSVALRDEFVCDGIDGIVD